jgi:Asp-tRNA(Asn)/Glu-tRNA(Gln) amidotransferase A subunit family amidase
MDVDFAAGCLTKGHLLGWVPPIVDRALRFDPLSTSASTLQCMLTSGSITSVQILNEYYRQILTDNERLKAVCQLTPQALEAAEELDVLRANGRIPCPLPDIPVPLKDSLAQI